MKILSFLFEIALFTALAFAEQGKTKITYTPEVVSLTTESFKENLENAPQVMVKFFSPSCPHCKVLEPVYQDVAKAVREKNVRVVVAEMDCSKNMDVCMDQGITKYPTIKFYKKGNFRAEFNGNRTVEEITNFTVEKSRGLIQLIHKKEVGEFIDKYKNERRHLIIGYFNRLGDEDYKLYERVAEKFGDEFVFGAAGDEEAAREAGGVIVPGVVMYKSYDEATPRKFTLTEDYLINFINDHKVPMVQELTPENLEMYMEKKIPLAIYYYKTDAQYKKHYQDLFEISQLYRDRLYFVASKQENGLLFDKNRFNKVPNFGIYDMNHPDFFYTFTPGKRMNQHNLVQFGEAYFRKEIIPQIIDEPEPVRKYENNVVVLDTNNYDDIVLDEDKDVAVLYYSQTCQYCQKLFPIWEHLGKRYLYQRQNITIAKFDAVNLKIPKSSPWTKLEYYPTIALYPAIDKVKLDAEAKAQNATIEQYHKGYILYPQEKVRDIKDIAEFIYKVTTHQSRIYMNISEIKQFDVYMDDEISSSEEEDSSDDEDLDADTAVERARKRKAAEERRKERLRRKEEAKRKKESKAVKETNNKEKGTKANTTLPPKDLPGQNKPLSSSNTMPAKAVPKEKSKSTKVVPEEKEKAKEKAKKDEL